MGGIAGHMNHLYDNPDLKFSQIKDIFEKAAAGELEGTEKTDGQNIFLSWSVKEGKAKAARNKGNIKSGGLDLKQLSDKFANKESLQQAFTGAMQAWETAVGNLGRKVQSQIFGIDADIWYNAEVQDPGTANVVNYDRQSLVIHQKGHAEFDKETGQVTGKDVSSNHKVLNNAIQNAEGKLASLESGVSFQVISAAVNRLRALDDRVVLGKAVGQLDGLLSSEGLSEDNTVGDYISKRVNKYISQSLSDLPELHREQLVAKILGAKGLNINKITKGLSPDLVQKVKVLASQASGLKSQLIFPLENIVHDFSVEMLRGLQSAFILHNKEEVQRLRGEVSKAIKAIQSSNEPGALKILDKQLQKLKSVENISTAVEGFVFDYDGATYKFTGNFAPINQILGLFQFGRGSIPPMKHLVKETQNGKILALLPGGFKPPHIGHWLAAQQYASIETVDEVRILISPKSRLDKTGEYEFSAKQSQVIWKIYAKRFPKVKPVISKAASPVQGVFDTLDNLPPNTKVILIVGEKDTGEESGRFKNVASYIEKNQLPITFDIVAANVPKKLNKVSATNFREAIVAGDYNKFIKFLPRHLTDKEHEKVWNIVANEEVRETIRKQGNKYCVYSHTSGRKFGCYDSKKGAAERIGQMKAFGEELTIKEVEVVEEDLLDEMSAMAGGAVQGAPSVFPDPEKKYTRRDLYKEGFIQRESLLEELQLRENIRQTVLDSIKERYSKSDNLLVFNAKLRHLIREQLLVEAEADPEDTPHGNTGINVLEDLLKKIVPQLEQDYKILTTNADQRESFKSHILKAVQSTITQADITANAPTDVKEMAEKIIQEIQYLNRMDVMDEADIDIKINDPVSDDEADEKFIDIDDKKSDDSEEVDTFGIEGKDETGRNMAQSSFEKIEKNIIDAYSVLSDPEDKKLFYDYLLTNLKLYFDKFEEELEPAPSEPLAGEEEADDEFGGDDLDI